MNPQISFLINFFIKNRSHGIIHTFKNYFAIVFSVFSFSKISSIQIDPSDMRGKRTKREKKNYRTKIIEHGTMPNDNFFFDIWKI